MNDALLRILEESEIAISGKVLVSTWNGVVRRPALVAVSKWWPINSKTLHRWGCSRFDSRKRQISIIVRNEPIQRGRCQLDPVAIAASYPTAAAHAICKTDCSECSLPLCAVIYFAADNAVDAPVLFRGIWTVFSGSFTRT